MIEQPRRYRLAVETRVLALFIAHEVRKRTVLHWIGQLSGWQLAQGPDERERDHCSAPVTSLTVSATAPLILIVNDLSCRGIKLARIHLRLVERVASPFPVVRIALAVTAAANAPVVRAFLGPFT